MPDGFWINGYPPLDQRFTIGEELDFRQELDDQTFDALSDKIGVLEAQVMLLADAVAILQALAFGLISPE